MTSGVIALGPVKYKRDNGVVFVLFCPRLQLILLSLDCNVVTVLNVAETLVGAEEVNGLAEKGTEAFDGLRGLVAGQPGTPILPDSAGT